MQELPHPCLKKLATWQIKFLPLQLHSKRKVAESYSKKKRVEPCQMLSIFRTHQKVNCAGSKQTILSHCLKAGYRHSAKASLLKTKKTLKTRSLTHFRPSNQLILGEANRNLLKLLETILLQKRPNHQIKIRLNANLQESVAIMSSKAAIQTLISTRLLLKIASLRSRPIISFRLKTPIL